MRDAEPGNAAIEFTLTGLLLVMMLAGTVNVGYGVYRGMLVQSAAEAGALYAAEHGWHEVGITDAVTGASRLAGITATPAPSQFCGCFTASGITPAACGTRCTDGSESGVYIQVNAALVHEQLLPYLGFGMPSTLTGRSVVRVR